MWIAIARILVGGTLGALFLLLMACATVVDFVETSRPVRRAESSPGSADEYPSRTEVLNEAAQS
jgi:hypothetical protein